MNKLETVIQNIYEIKYHSIITPNDLLDNAKLDNYSYVNYYRKCKDELVVEMECMCDDGIRREFNYTFDNNDNLLQAKATPGNLLHTDVLFDREIELKILLAEYNEQQNKLQIEKVG